MKLCWQHSHGVKQRWRALTRSQSVTFVLAVVGVVGVFVTILAWRFPHVWEQRIGTAESPAINPCLVVLYGNEKLDGQTIVTGGRAGVLNGLVIPAFQIKSTKNVTIFGVRLYLSEGDGRWDGPWEPTPSDEDAFPAEFYWGAVFQLNSQETWNTPALTSQRNKGIPWGRTIKARIKIYYGASAPLTADFTLHNNESTPASKAVPAPSKTDVEVVLLYRRGGKEEPGDGTLGTEPGGTCGGT
jgi:hypothetical protein